MKTIFRIISINLFSNKWTTAIYRETGIHIPTDDKHDFEIARNSKDTIKTQNEVELLCSNTREALRFSKSILQLRLKIVRRDDTELWDTYVVTFVNNIGANAFSEIRLTANDKEIERNLFPGLFQRLKK